MIKSITYLCIFSTLFLIGCFKDPKHEKDVYESFNSVDIYELFYQEDPKSEILIGKWIEIRGEVKHLGTDSAYRPYIALHGNAVGDIQCFLSRDLEKNPPQLKKGEQVTIRGRCLSWVIHLALDDCTVQKTQFINEGE